MPRGEIRPLLSPTQIKQARELAGIDQGRLATFVGISRKTVVMVESKSSDKVDARRRAVLERIRHVFECDFELEFTFADDPEGETVRRHQR